MGSLFIVMINYFLLEFIFIFLSLIIFDEYILLIRILMKVVGYNELFIEYKWYFFGKAD